MPINPSELLADNDKQRQLNDIAASHVRSVQTLLIKLEKLFPNRFGQELNRHTVEAARVLYKLDEQKDLLLWTKIQLEIFEAAENQYLSTESLSHINLEE